MKGLDVGGLEGWVIKWMGAGWVRSMRHVAFGSFCMFSQNIDNSRAI